MEWYVLYCVHKAHGVVCVAGHGVVRIVLRAQSLESVRVVAHGVVRIVLCTKP